MLKRKILGIHSSLHNFFAKDYAGPPFRFFGPAHLTALAIIAAINVSLVFLKLYVPQNGHKVFRTSLIVIWCVNEIVRHCWYVRTGQWTLKDNLPLHVCPLSGYLATLMLLTGNYRLYEFVYFIGIPAPGISLLTPDLDRYGFPHYQFFLFFISHSLPVTAAIYMTIVEGYQPSSLASIVRVAIEINAFMLCVGILNKILRSNYIFLSHKPSTPSIIDVLGPWPWYILGMEGIGWLILLLLYLPFLF